MLIYVIFADPDNAEAKSPQADTSSSSGTAAALTVDQLFDSPAISVTVNGPGSQPDDRVGLDPLSSAR
jgi:hypothetical protein